MHILSILSILSKCLLSSLHGCRVERVLRGLAAFHLLGEKISRCATYRRIAIARKSDGAQAGMTW